MFYEQLKKVCNNNNITPTMLLKKLQISTGNLGSWKNGGNPSVEVLKRIADHFNVSTDYLLGNEQKNTSTDQAEVGIDKDFANVFSKLSDNQKQVIRDMMNSWIDKGNK